jgi:hypothetical protein
MEPWDGMRLPPAELFASIRSELARGELSRGRLDVESLRSSGEVRWGSDGEFPHRVETASDCLVGVKWPAFWRYLDKLPETKFLVCVRNPVDVVASFATMQGQLSKGLNYDIPFNHAMNEALRAETDDPAIRRASLFEYIGARIAPYLDRPNVFPVRYERWFQDRGGLMRDIADFLGASLGPGEPVIREPVRRPHDPETVRSVAERCPSASALGYEGFVAESLHG